MKYLATINVPGYLPTDDNPPTFEWPWEAWSYLAAERGDSEVDLPGDEWSATYNTLDSMARKSHYESPAAADWLADEGLKPDGTGSIFGETPGYDGSHDLGLVYTVTAVEEHVGSLMSGEVTCSCGWTSGHYALAMEARVQFGLHVTEMRS